MPVSSRSRSSSPAASDRVHSQPSFWFDGSLFAAGDMERLAGRLLAVLRSTAADPEARLDDLEAVGDAERQALLVGFNSTQSPSPQGRCVHHLFAEQVARTPDAIAVVGGEERLTFRELGRRAGWLARWLRGRSVGPDVPVALAAARSPEMLIAVLGILEAGGAYVPVDPTSPAERISFVLEQSRAALLLAELRLLAALPDGGVEVVDLDVALEQAAEGTGGAGGGAVPESLAYVLYTSGSTGVPKGVMVTHQGLCNYLTWACEAYLDGSGRGAPLHSPLGFDLTVTSLFGPLLAGVPVVVIPEEGPGALVEPLAAGEPFALVKATPAHLEVLNRLLPPEAFATATRVLVVGGEAFRGETVRPWGAAPTAVRIVNEYGPTETVVGCCVYELPAGAPIASNVPIGKPIANTQIYLVNPRGRIVPAGVAGELLIGGAGLARGYLGQPSLTAERFVPDPFGGAPGGRLYRSGDLALLRWDGELEYLGRIDRQVKVRGFRIELEEIEAVLGQHAAVREAVVLAREDVPGDRRLVAYVVGADGGAREAGLLREHLGRKLPDYMLPAAWVWLESMPLTPNGKVDRRALPPPDEVGGTGGAAAHELSPVEEMVAGVWCEVLGRGRVGADDDFFQIGGHSLLATQVMFRLSQIFGIRLPVNQLFETPTVGGLAGQIEAHLRQQIGPVPPLVPAGREGELPLSFAQERLWFLDRLQAGPPVYNVPIALRLSGALDVCALEASLGEVVRRHEVLRTAYPEVAGRPVQRILQPGRSLPLVDLSGLAPGQREPEARRLARREALSGFDLARGPVLRTTVVRLAEAEHLLLLTVHHIASDGFSLQILIREAAALYGAFVAGRPSPLPDLPVQYADFARWQRHLLTGEALDRELDYWRDRLSGAPSSLDLPTDRPRPPIPSYRGAEEPWALSPVLSLALEEGARRHGATLFMVLVAAFQVLLARYADQEEVLLGTAVAGRVHPETEGLIGCFVNMLVLRAAVGDAPSFTGFLARVREAALGAYAHQELPFERLVEELRPERDLSRSPLFQAMLVLERVPPETPGIPGLLLASEPVGAAVARFEWTLWAFAAGERIQGTLEYATDLFDRATVRRAVGHLGSVLAAAASDPERPVRELLLLSAAERQQIAWEWNDTGGRAVPLPMPQAFEALAASEPDRVAIELAGLCLTYSELDRRAARLAGRLRALGAGAGAHVGIVGVCLERSPRLPLALLGVLKAGGAYLPLDPSHPPERLQLMLDDSGAAIVVTEEALASRFAGSGAALLDLDRDDATPEPEESRGCGPSPDDRAYVIYTSGSTGRPKGVEVCHGSLANFLGSMRRRPGLDAKDRLLAVTSPSFDITALELYLPLAVGARIVLASREEAMDGRLLAAAWERAQATVLQATPATWALLTAAGWPGASAGMALCGGEELGPALAEALARRGPAWNLYGPTETTVWSTVARVEPASADRPVSIGRPIANTEVHVVDADLSSLPVGLRGELVIGGDGVARGYLGRPDLTAERFVPDSFSQRPGARLYRTGDMARWRPDGTLAFAGRRDHQVKLRGHRIELGEIEAALAACPGVREAVAVAQGEGSERRLVAYVAGGGAPVAAVAVRAALAGRLPAVMLPEVVVLDALPRTPNGKVDRRALPAPERPGSGVGLRSPRTPTEEILAGIWEAVLGRPGVGVDENFFAVGGHSLLAAQVVARVREHFGVELPVARVFEAPTVEAQAREIAVASAPDAPPLRPLARRPGGGERWPLSFAQEGLWFLAQLDPASTSYNLSHAVEAVGDLDLRSLRRALAALVERHEVLRTTFGVEEGRGFQQPGPPWAPDLPLVDLQGLAPDRRDREVQRLTAAEAQRPFDLTRGPLLRTAVLRLGAAEHVVLLAIHHIVADGWSMGLLVRDLAELYQGLREARAPRLPALPVQYADYAAWQRSWLSGTALERRLAFWREELAGAPVVLELPADHPRPASGSHRGGRRPVHLGEPLRRGLRQLAQGSGATLFMALAAGFAALLARHANRDDLLLGAVTAQRDRFGTDEVIGLFANTLVLRADLSGQPSFRELLRRVRRTALAALSHGDVPFEKLVEELRPERDLAHSPLVQVVTVLQNLPVGAAQLPGLDLRPLDAGVATAKFDLTLGLVEAGGEVAGALEHSRDLFEPATVERLIGHLVNLLGAAVADPSRGIWDLPLLAAAERQQLLLEWNAPASVGGPEALLHELFAARVDRDPEAVAVLCAAERLSYRELEERANRLAGYLRRLIGAGDLVGLYLDRSLELPVAVLAVLKAGGAYVPLDPAYPRERLATVLEDAGVSVLLTRSDLRQHLPETPARVIDLDAEREAIARQPAVRPAVLVPDGSPAYVIYTSGSTGHPKGCLISHRNVARLFAATAGRFGFDAHDVWTLFHSYAFDFSVWELWGAFLHGGRLVIVPYWVSRSPDAFYELLAREGVTVLNQTPSAFRQLVQAAEQAASAQRTALRLRWVIFGGEALDLAGLAPWLARHGDAAPALINMYGITETTVHVTFRRVAAADLAQAHRSPLGTALADLSLDLLDPFLHLVPIGAPGEMYIGGAGVALGYLGRPELTAERFVPDPFGRTPGARLYRSGDLARYRPDGDLDFLGRIDQQVKVRGFRIELGEVEAACANHPAVGEVAVAARREGPERMLLVAYLVPAAGRELAVAELRRFLLDRLPDYMVPAAFVLLDRLPRTPSGKLDRKSLPDPRQEPQPLAADTSPRQPAEALLAAIWADLLGIPQPGIHDNFFELGGDSIVAIQVVARASRAGLSLTPRQLFERQTIAELAAVAGSARPVTAEQGPVTGEVPLTPIQQRFFAGDPADPHHHNQALLLAVRTRPDAARLETAIATLLVHHDALRLRFHNTEDGWRQCAVEPDGRAPWTWIDLAALPEPAFRGMIEGACAAAQANFDLTAGPLLRAMLFDLGEDRPGRLLLAAHHLVVDGVSWRILLEDLQAAYEQAGSRQPVRLPTKTTSYKRWAENLAGEARSGALRELAAWTAALPGLAPPLPLDDPAAPDVEAGSAQVLTTLTEEETEALLRGTLAGFRSGIQEVLVTCVALALAGWTGSRRVLLDLEGHGREELEKEMDLSRTVGWFTAIYPVELDLGAAVDPLAALKRVKEQLRAVPRGGVGYGLLRFLAGEAAAGLPRRGPEIAFNYLGQLDRALDTDALLQPARESAGPPRSQRQRRSHRLVLDSSVSGGRLQMAWTFGAGHRRATIERVAAESLRFLQAVIELGRATETAAFTPSDFPLARLDQRTVDLLAGNDRDIEDIYPLAPAQQGLLFHAVSAPQSGAYVYQMACRLEGALDEESFAHAWQEVVARHAVLRTGFSWQAADEPLQVVRRRVAAPVERLDWSGAPAAEQPARLDGLLAEDRRRGFDPARPPLARLALARIGEGSCWLVWTCHHLVIDGWSVPVLVREVLALCGAFAEGRPAALDRVRPYRDFIAWLADQDPSAAEGYWRQRLAGFRRPVQIGSDSAAGRSGGTTAHLASVPAGLSCALEELGRRHRLTLATLLQGAWALLLSDLGGTLDVVFGGVVSGRPPELSGSGDMVGMFINTLPVRAQVDLQAALLPWLAELQERQLAAQSYAHVPLAEIRRWSEVPSGLPLFESTFAFNNYPAGGPLTRSGGSMAIAEVRELEATSYALDLTVAATGGELSLRIMYDRSRFGGEEIQELVGSLLALLAAMTERPEGRLSDCLAALAQRRPSELAVHRFKAVKPKAVTLLEEEAR